MALDTSYRAWSDEQLEAVRISVLTQMKGIEAVGQSNALNGRTTGRVNYKDLIDVLNNIELAKRWKADPANAGNLGYTSRYTDFSRECY